MVLTALNLVAAVGACGDGALWQAHVIPQSRNPEYLLQLHEIVEMELPELSAAPPTLQGIESWKWPLAGVRSTATNGSSNAV